MPALRPALACLVVVALLALVGPAQAQFGDDSGVPDYVSVTVRLDRDGYHPGETARVVVEFKIDPRVHVNSDTPTADYQFPTSLEWTDEAGLHPSAAKWPKAAMKAFEFTEGEKIAVFEGVQRATLSIPIPADAAPGTRTLAGAFRAQGCTHTTCYAPQTDEFSVPLRIVAAGETTAALNAEASGGTPSAAGGGPSPAEPAEGATAGQPAAVGAEPPSGTPATPAEMEAATSPASGSDDVAAGPDGSASTAMSRGGVPPPDQDDPDAQCPTGEPSRLASDRPLAGVFLFSFLAGILLAFTPCVLPLVPITIGFFARQQERGRRPVVPAMLYVLGLALVYSALGTVAALSGGLFGAMLQKPIVIVGIAGILFALALSMFGLWDLNLPSFISNRLGGGRGGNLGAMAMGSAMGLVAAPCVGPLVVSLLTYVAELGSRMPPFRAALVGGGLFFTLSIGLGLPFFIVALGAGSLRPGEWMVSVKKVFGFIILGLVLFFLRPLIGTTAFEWGIVLVLAAGGIYFLLHSRAPEHGPRARIAVAATGVVSLVAMVAWSTVALRHVGGGAVRAHAFAEYSDEALARAKADGRPVVVDFSAEWCIACKELEHQTFPDGRVQKHLQQFVSLRADLTVDNERSRALYKQWGIRGLPTILFLDSQGQEIKPLRLTGFEPPEEFVQRLDCVTRLDIAAR